MPTELLNIDMTTSTQHDYIALSVGSGGDDLQAPTDIGSEGNCATEQDQKWCTRSGRKLRNNTGSGSRGAAAWGGRRKQG